MNKIYITIFLVFGVIFLVGGILAAFVPPQNDPKIDAFAKCLGQDKGVTMYGASWCPHCQNEKRRFGSSFQYINYVECPNNTQLCTERGITGYPTWIFADGKRLEGEQGLQNLAKESGCKL